MIEIKKTTSKEVYEEFGFDSSSTVMAVKDGDELLGAGSVTLKDGYAVMDKVCMKESYKMFNMDFGKYSNCNIINTSKSVGMAEVEIEVDFIVNYNEIAEYEKDGVEMSQYDLEYMQKKYDLRLAEIALEEAQNAKSQVRLTRDASGNYSYLYS